MKISTVEELLSEFNDCLDRDERLQLILELGDDLDPLPEEEKTEANRVRGCQSNVWMVSRVVPGTPARIHFDADSDGQIVRVLIAVLLSLVNDKTPAEILAVDLDGIFKQLDLARYISHSRSSGLASMVKRVRDLARRTEGAV
jgi:cysteine desulfuration protein SufE